MAESTHDQLKRVRKPRVHITYEVQVGDAIEKREIPFVVGVLADLSGDRDPAKAMQRVKDRKFTEIDRDNFNEVMKKIEPRLTLGVDNTLDATTSETGDKSQLMLELKFKELGDFSPDKVVSQVPALKEILEIRNKLANLRTSLYGNDKLEELLNQVIEQTSAKPKGEGE